MSGAETTSVSYLMKFQNPEKLKNVKKVVKNLTTLGVLILGLSSIFYSPKFSSSATINTKCSDVVGTAKPGNNCLFYNLPLCSTIPSVDYTIAPTEVLSASSTKLHRENCADLSDLPACGQIDAGNAAANIKNCFKDCGEKDASGNLVITDPNPAASPALIRGVSYAVHNRDCVRFCDKVAEESLRDSEKTQCVTRKCHQVVDAVTPVDSGASKNCDIHKCNLLTPDELNENRMTDSSKKYCDGDVKCYNFSYDQLPFVQSRGTNTMCKIHDCRPTSSSCAPDDTLNITSKGLTYVGRYQRYINANQSLDNTLFCNPTISRPTIQRPYRCTTNGTTVTGNDAQDTVKNSLCDSTGVGATCVSNFCYKTIDCCVAANNSQPECTNSSTNEDNSIGSTDDTMNSWFYRPKPEDGAVSNGVLRNMNPELCYTGGQLESNGWGSHPRIDFGPLGVLDLGFYHDYMNLGNMRSPGLCNKSSLGFRMTGFVYLCGTNLNLYSSPSDQAGFHKGYVKTEFTESGATHKLVVCLRFNNVMIPSKTCGSRQCGISCFGNCEGGGSEVCGTDVCRELTLSETDSPGCMMTNDLFQNNPSKGCMSTIDDYLRIRAVEYDDKICTFLDVRGHTSYPSFRDKFLDPQAKLSDGTCISGTVNSSGSCVGTQNTRDDETLAHRWRTMLRIPYIQNNQPSEKPSGYLDRSGQLFPEQECIKTSLRIPPPRFYNLANSTNSFKLFIPPLYIQNVNLRRGAAVSTPSAGEFFGKTDFHFPEMVVRFGATTKKLSLGLGYTGHETSSPDPLGSATITSRFGTVDYSVETFVRKEFSADSLKPIFCLYRKVKDSDGSYMEPVVIACVTRNFSELDNRTMRLVDSSLTPERLMISADPSNTYSSSKIVLRYLGGLDSASGYGNCNNNNCTAPTSIANTDVTIPTCNTDIEKHKVCAQREECSQLNIECIKNEIDMQTAKNARQSIDSYLSVRRNCNENILRKCNEKKGITSDPSATITNTNPSGAAADPNAYGWFNEICISSGFESKLKDVIAYRFNSGLKGKCKIDTAISTGDCSAGGNGKTCFCIERVAGVIEPNANANPPETYRKKTPHEAGLCVDMPLPKSCPAISYGGESDPVQNYYIDSSLNNNAYGNSLGQVHTSHQLRNNGTAFGHGEFPQSIFGMNDIEGQCSGFWRYASNGSSAEIKPRLNCLNVGGNASWENPARNSCIRYSCPAVLAEGPDISGMYQGDYTPLGEVGENKGLSNGFAEWTSFTKTDDFLQNDTASGCITGFKKNGATADMSIGYSDVVRASLFEKITGYTGGTLPTRNCNQIGIWTSTSNNCVRITCPAVNPPANPSVNDTDAWDLWYNAGGARFGVTTNADGSCTTAPCTTNTTLASRSPDRIQGESVATGTCNNALGFFQAPGAPAPTRSCDHLGNWKDVVNPCVTSCGAVTALADASSDVNGYTYWNEATGVPLRGEKAGVIITASGNGGCVAGHYPYPYPPLKTDHGDTLTISASGPYRTDSGANSTLTTIPLLLSNDTRAATAPKRFCKSVITSGGTANVWTGTSSRCVNYCPGADTDPRIGAGATQHILANGTTITINWPQANVSGQWAYATGILNAVSVTLDSPNLTQTDASFFSGNTRNNGHFAIARYCNPTTHKWDAPIVQCVTKNGQITDSNAQYNTPTNLIADDAATTTVPQSKIATGACITGYYKQNYDTGALSRYKCVAKDAGKKIDQYYFSKIDGDPCKRYCKLNPNQVIGNSMYVNSGSSCGATNAACAASKVVIPGFILTCTSATTTTPCPGGSKTNFFEYGPQCCPSPGVWSDNWFLGGNFCYNAAANSIISLVPYVSTSSCTETARVATNGYFFDANDQVPLACKNANFGKKITGGSRATVAGESVCGRDYVGIATTDRTSNSPYVVCQADGTWGAIVNDCEACRSCSSSSTRFGHQGGCRGSGSGDCFASVSSDVYYHDIGTAVHLGVSPRLKDDDESGSCITKAKSCAAMRGKCYDNAYYAVCKTDNNRNCDVREDMTTN